jgi:tetratricopeptide (TPR) repeat protein
MERTAYRHEASAAALKPWIMPRQPCRSLRNRRHLAWRISLLALGALTASCKPPAKSVEKSPPALTVDNELLKQLTTARLDAAKSKQDQHRPDEALALLISSLHADPASEETRAMVESILKETVWNLPILAIYHAMPIEQIALSEPSSLWVSLGGKTNTTVRWNLDALRIESVLFPEKDCKTRSLIFDKTHRRVVIERGSVTLLCDAQTLKPIRELGVLPDSLTPSAVVAFSRDGLLVAHPASATGKDRSILWHLRDAATGEILRSTEPVPNAAPPLAAYLDREQLRVIHADGSLLEIPVSPVEEIRRKPLPEPVKLLQAQFSEDGNSVLTLQAQGPHEPPVQSVITYRDGDDGSLEPKALARNFPWSRQPTLWSGLLKGADDAPFSIEGSTVKILTTPHADIDAGSPLTAVAFDENQVLTGDKNGVLTFHRLLPLPTTRAVPAKPAPPNSSALIALTNLCDALAATRYDAKDRTFTRLSPEARLKAFQSCDPEALISIFPALDFGPVSKAFTSLTLRAAEPAAFQPLHDRLAQAEPADPPPALAETFRSNDSPAILAAIQASGEKGSAAATALTLALKSDHPEWIEACLTTARDLPPLLRQLSRSRIAWLRGRKADALAGWPDVFPDLTEVRRREDWAGWEQADFKPVLDQLRECVSGELAAIKVPENSTPEQRKAIATRLADPATLTAVGPRRFADACLKAATAFSAFKDETETTFQLASRAREMGAPAEPCLRAEALALTALGDYQKAHPRWIELITEHPVETTVPDDYAEAAYTAFENSAPRQAMEILTTGMHRFPQDADFALRAGWISLLTGNSERAYRFLREGKRIGLPPEKLENATALLAIAAAQSGATDDAAVHFQDLLKLNPAWAEPATVEALDWPEEMKAVFGGFSR